MEVGPEGWTAFRETRHIKIRVRALGNIVARDQAV
jgi:hypothetical protein